MQHNNNEAIVLSPKFPFFIIIIILLLLIFPLKLNADEISIENTPSFNTEALPNAHNMLYKDVYGTYYLLSTELDLGYYKSSGGYEYIKGIISNENAKSTLFYFASNEGEWRITASKNTAFSIRYSTYTTDNAYNYYEEILWCDTPIYNMVDATTIDYSSIYRDVDKLTFEDTNPFTQEQATQLVESLIIIRKILSFFIIIFFLFLIYKFIKIFL